MHLPAPTQNAREGMTALSEGTLGLVAIVTVLAWLPTGAWWCRIWEFPRVQIAVVAAMGAMVAWIEGAVWMAAALATLAAVNAGHVWPYTPLGRRMVPDALPGAMPDLTVGVFNLDVRNPAIDAAVSFLAARTFDLLVLVEIDERWAKALAPVAERYPYRVDVVRDRGLGLALYSRRPLEDDTVRHLVSGARPSIWARVRVSDGRAVSVAAVHPTPPGLERRDGERHDSRIRDAELTLVARDVAERRDEHWLVAGDFNDVAWSRTTRLFEKVSGLADPRRGRGLLNTYHARYLCLRYPIDQVFVCDGLAVASLARSRLPGSDHFGVTAAFTLAPQGGVEPTATPEDQAEARVMIDEGRRDARVPPP